MLIPSVGTFLIRNGIACVQFFENLKEMTKVNINIATNIIIITTTENKHLYLLLFFFKIRVYVKKVWSIS